MTEFKVGDEVIADGEMVGIIESLVGACAMVRHARDGVWVGAVHLLSNPETYTNTTASKRASIASGDLSAPYKIKRLDEVDELLQRVRSEKPKRVGYWEALFSTPNTLFVDPMEKTITKLDVHYATKQEFDELESTTGNTSYNTGLLHPPHFQQYDCLINNKEFIEKPDMTFKHNGPVIGTFDSITDEEGGLRIKGTLNEAGVKFMDDIKNHDDAEDLIERMSKAVNVVIECLKSRRVNRALLRLEDVKLDLDDYREGDVS